MHVCLQEHRPLSTCRCTDYPFFWFFSVCFETGMIVLFVSIHVPNTETNRNKPKYFLFVYRTPYVNDTGGALSAANISANFRKLFERP
jgi:hypothetical protein